MPRIKGATRVRIGNDAWRRHVVQLTPVTSGGIRLDVDGGEAWLADIESAQKEGFADPPLYFELSAAQARELAAALLRVAGHVREAP